MSLARNSTVPEFHGAEINTLALNIVKDSISSAGVTMVEISLAGVSFGILTVLSFASVYFLVGRGSLAHANAKILLLSTVLLYLFAGTYLGTLVWNRTLANRVVLGAMEGLFSPSYDGRGEMAAFAEEARKQSWVAVIAFDAICISGDGIVWWRACVIWRNKIVYCVGMLLVTFTLGVLYSGSFLTLFRGSVFTASRADSPNVLVIVGYRSTQVIPTTAIAILATDNIYIKAAGTVSLTTNALATALIAFKAWEHRQLVREQFSMAGTKSRVLNALALLVESGSGYSTLLIFMVFYEMDPVPSPDRAGRMFTSVAECIFYGCFAPIAAMYPTVIIVLVALKRSPIDTGGLSRVYQIHDSGGGSVDKGTLVFHRSTSCSTITGDVEVASAEIRTSEPRRYPQAYSCP